MLLLRRRGRLEGSGSGRRRRLSFWHILTAGRQDGVQDGPLHARHEFHQAGIAHILDEAIDHVVAELAMGHLAAPEAQAGLHLVTLSQKTDHLVLLGLIVVLVNRNGELDLLDGDDLLTLARGAFALFLFVEIPAIILDAADWRNGVR